MHLTCVDAYICVRERTLRVRKHECVCDSKNTLRLRQTAPETQRALGEIKRHVDTEVLKEVSGYTNRKSKEYTPVSRKSNRAL